MNNSSDTNHLHSWTPIIDKDARLTLKEAGQCPDCGSRYLHTSIPWQPGTCVDVTCIGYSDFQTRKCAICQRPRWECSC